MSEKAFQDLWRRCQQNGAPLSSTLHSFESLQCIPFVLPFATCAIACTIFGAHTHTHSVSVSVCVWRCVERFSEFIFKMRHNDNDDNARSQFGSVRFGSLGSQRGKGNRVVVVVVLYICFLDFRTLSGSKNKFDGISPCQRNKFYWMSNALCPKLLSYFTLWTLTEAENMMYYTSRERNNVLFCYYLYK